MRLYLNAHTASVSVPYCARVLLYSYVYVTCGAMLSGTLLISFPSSRVSWPLVSGELDISMINNSLQECAFVGVMQQTGFLLHSCMSVKYH